MPDQLVSKHECKPSYPHHHLTCPPTPNTKTHFRRLRHFRRTLLLSLRNHHNRRLRHPKHVRQPLPKTPQTHLTPPSHSGDIASVGFDASYAIGTSNTTAITTSATCPDYCDCGLQAVAYLWNIVGIHNVVSVNPPLGVVRGSECNFEQNVAYPYDITVPQTIKGAAPNADARVDFSACSVGTVGGACGTLPLCPGT